MRWEKWNHDHGPELGLVCFMTLCSTIMLMFFASLIFLMIFMTSGYSTPAHVLAIGASVVGYVSGVVISYLVSHAFQSGTFDVEFLRP